MPTSPQDIVDALDAAILAWAGKPVSLSFSGRSVAYSSLGELAAARDYYAQLAASKRGANGFRLTQIRHGGPA